MDMKVLRHTGRTRLDSFPRALGRGITIGLLNNMPDEALKVTEKQFTSLIYTSADGIDVAIRMFALRDMPRSPAAREYLEARCEGVSILDSELDGLVVTGAAPSAALLDDEPYWRELSEIIEWAKTGTASTIFSCLAAHAGVWYLDRVERRALPEKLVGLFSFAVERDHRLVGRRGSLFVTPHSRYNGLFQSDLERAGYDILASSPVAGVDIFTKSFGSEFVFLQGHPEYQANSLAREYRRDIGRCQLGEADRVPVMPKNYFSTEAEADLLALGHLAHDEACGGLEKLAIIEALAPSCAVWQEQATSFYRNWIEAIVARTQQTLGDASKFELLA
jgi:homoserine O-succinyltransferase